MLIPKLYKKEVLFMLYCTLMKTALELIVIEVQFILLILLYSIKIKPYVVSFKLHFLSLLSSALVLYHILFRFWKY